jgi:site-specific DNA-cytosine methylase
MKVLVACEYSGIVRDAFIKVGHDAISCDLLDTERPGPHYKGNVLDILYEKWDLIIAHPPCTYFSRAASRILYNPDRIIKTMESFEFVKKIWNAPTEKICIENPPGWLSTNWQRPSQKVHPWYFGDNEMKETCLFLKNLPLLRGHSYIMENKDKYKPRPHRSKIGSDGKMKNQYFVGRITNSKDRAKTFPGIAWAMAATWG